MWNLFSMIVYSHTLPKMTKFSFHCISIFMWCLIYRANAYLHTHSLDFMVDWWSELMNMFSFLPQKIHFFCGSLTYFVFFFHFIYLCCVQQFTYTLCRLIDGTIGCILLTVTVTFYTIIMEILHTDFIRKLPQSTSITHSFILCACVVGIFGCHPYRRQYTFRLFVQQRNVHSSAQISLC